MIPDLRLPSIVASSERVLLGAGLTLVWEEGEAQPSIEHRCARPDATILSAPQLQHDISGSREAPTIRPSVLCSDCGLHGWITDGKWTDA